MIVLSMLFLLAAPLIAEETTQDARPKKLLLIGQGPDGHPPTMHEFMAGVRVIAKLLEPVAGIETKIVKADEPWTEGPELLADADGIVLMVTQGARWMQTDPKRFEALEKLAARGGAIVALHWSIGARDGKFIPGQLKLLGGTRGGPQRKYTVVETDVKVVDRRHPIMSGVGDFRVHDEFYYRLDLMKDSPTFRPLLEVRLEDKDETVCWAWERPDGGRSFGYVGVHFHRTWRLPEYRRFITQGILWTLKKTIPPRGLDVDIDPVDLQLPAAPAKSEKAAKARTGEVRKSEPKVSSK